MFLFLKHVKLHWKCVQVEEERLHLVRLLYESGQEGSQFQQLTGAVPWVEVQVEVGQPAEVGKGLSRSWTQTVSGQIQSAQAHQPTETRTTRQDHTAYSMCVLLKLFSVFSLKEKNTYMICDNVKMHRKQTQNVCSCNKVWKRSIWQKYALTCFGPDDLSGYLTHPDSPDLWGHLEGRNQSPNWWAGFLPVSGSAEPLYL